MRLPEAAEPRQPGGGEDQRIGRALAKAAQPGVDIAANLDRLQIGSHGRDLGRSPRAAGTDPRARWELGQGTGPSGDQDIAGILPREKCRQGQAWGRQRRKVLG